MSDFLEQILASTRARIACAKSERTLEELELLIARGARGARVVRPAAGGAEDAGGTGSARPAQPTGGEGGGGGAFAAALRAPGLAFICEVKQASPSKGQLVEEAAFDYRGIARAYEAAGAAAVSVLTEPEFFRGHNRYLFDIAEDLHIPTLRKDFIIDDYQVYEARVLGAAAILLIVAALDDVDLIRLLRLASELEMDALVEVHDEQELERALATGARIVGVNNRDLTTFEVSLATSERLGPLLPDGCLFVAESGIRTPADVRRMREAGADAVLVGEALMRAGDVAATLAEFRAAADAAELRDERDPRGVAVGEWSPRSDGDRVEEGSR